ncbi:MAG: DUF721 domain-containing protein [Deltaproteobacteria bacterium]|nr:DUF721 domain-containing protein [Deltaproteobacteria bacterium]
MMASERLIDDALAAVNLPADFFSDFVIARWTNIVAPEVSRFAVPVSIRGGTLWLRPQSREARFALAPLAEAIRAAVVRATGSTRIKEVRFLES